MVTTSEDLVVKFRPTVLKALRLRAQEAGVDISEYVNDAVQLALNEDAEDIAAFEERRDEPTRSFEEFVAEMRERGDL